MKLWQRIRFAFQALVQKERLDREMDAEMRFHLEMLTRDNLENGMTAEEARGAAWRSFGRMEQLKEICREGRGVRWLEALSQDIRFGTRMFVKTPAVTGVAVLSLALGIGANTLVFTWIRGTLTDAILGVEQPNRLMVIAPVNGSSGLGENMSLPDIESIARARDAFKGITACQMGAVPVRLDLTSEWLWGQTTLANYFEVLGVRLILGRGFLLGEDRPSGSGGVAVISDSLWRLRFGGSPDVLGRVIQINQRPVTIVGVAPPGFRGTVGGLAFDLWVPLATESGMGDLNSRFGDRGSRWLQTIARLQDGVSLQRGQVALTTEGQRLAREFPQTNKDTTFRALRIWESPWGGQALFLPVLRVLVVVSGLMLVLVIANVGNLLLARGLARQREMSLRAALGCSPGRLARQVLTDGLLLAVLGGTGGLLFALLTRNVLLALLPSSYLPIRYDLPMSGGVFAVTAALSIVTGLAVGLGPAWRAVRLSLNEDLKVSGGRATVSRPHARIRFALAIGQVGLAFVLLLSMGLCIRSYSLSRRMNLGFDPAHLWLAGFRLNPHSGTDDGARSFFRHLQTQIKDIPGVESAALSSYIPLGIEGIDFCNVKVPGYTPAPGENVNAGIEVVSPGYFKTLKMQLVSGREFSETDDERMPLVVIVNEAFSNKYYPSRDCVGLKFDTGDGEARIIGVARTAKYRSLGEPPLPYVYLCAWQRNTRNMTLAVRVTRDSGPVNHAITQLAVALDPDCPPHASMSCEAYVGSAFTVPRVAVTLLSFLGLLAGLLATMGMYAVVSHNITQRLREFAVRMALGAQTRNIFWLGMRQGLGLTAAGLGIGAAAGLAVTRLLASVLVGVSGADLVIWLSVPCILICTILAACCFPARQALLSDLPKTLRSE
jgi:predicted permease